MTGIILAAGKGSRLNGSAADVPKCLVQVGGLTLVERQTRSLAAAGIDDIVVVIGCQAEHVRRSLPRGVRFVENQRFAETNSLYSLWLARPHLAEGFVVLNCDVLFHPQLLRDLLTARYQDALLVAPREDDAPFGQEEMKVVVRAGRVVAISKALDPLEADGENLGIARFGRDGAALVADLLDEGVARGGLREWVPRAFEEFARRRPLYAIGTRGLPWIEIDFPEDYRRAVAEVLPAIEKGSGTFSPAGQSEKVPDTFSAGRVA
jgi:choline kinase